jgi:Flp pilus assembly protein TadD
MQTNDNDDHANKSLSLYYYGKREFKNGNMTEAVRLLKESWLSDNHAHTAHTLSMAYMKLSDANESHTWIVNAYRLNPFHNRIATDYAASLYLQGRVNEAISVLLELLRRVPTYGPARKLLDQLQS